MKNYEYLKKELACIEHERWADWQKYMHSLCTKNPDGSLTIPREKVIHWERQIKTIYSELTPREQKYDMDQVDRYWPRIEEILADAFGDGYDRGMKDERDRIEGIE